MENKIKTLASALFLVCLLAGCVSEKATREGEISKQMRALKKPPQEVP
jgi:PBP1b-binding outer membrane lipoprotein LpoB